MYINFTYKLYVVAITMFSLSVILNNNLPYSIYYENFVF